jgi:hypothetical protein
LSQEKKKLEKNTPNDLHTDNQGRNTTILKDTHTSSQPHGQQGDTQNRKIERTKESLQHHHVQSNKNNINNNNKPKKSVTRRRPRKKQKKTHQRRQGSEYLDLT